MTTLSRIHHRASPAYVTPVDHLDDLFAGFFRPLAAGNGSTLPEIKIDVHEDAKAYLVSASIPGAKKDDIHVSVDGNEVQVEVEIKREISAKETEGQRTLHTERFYGKASRSFSLAQEIDENAVEARYADGVLSLTLPKKAQVSAKRVTIN